MTDNEATVQYIDHMVNSTHIASDEETVDKLTPRHSATRCKLVKRLFSAARPGYSFLCRMHWNGQVPREECKMLIHAARLLWCEYGRGIMQMALSMNVPVILR